MISKNWFNNVVFQNHSVPIKSFRQGNEGNSVEIDISDLSQEFVPSIPSITIQKVPLQYFSKFDIEKIRKWLFSIEEPEEFHYLVIDKCKQDPEAFKYFLNWANRDNGEKSRVS